MERREIHGVVLPVLVGCVMLTTSLVLSAFSFPPSIKRPFEIVEATTEGGSPETVDPAWSYDTASGELICNVYETLLTYDGEHVDKFVPQLATAWTIENITVATSPEGLQWYFRYAFAVRTGVRFQDGSTLTPEDVEYSFERSMIQDREGGPQRMLYEPLLNVFGADDLGNVGIPEEAARIGKMIDHAVESNSTHVWFNLAFPGAYGPWLQILCQTLSSIISKQWVKNHVITTQGRPDWDGEWGDYTGWVAYHNPSVSPLDSPTPVMDGTGPFMLETLDYAEKYWSVIRNADYWRGWPTSFSKLAGWQPAGYVTRIKVTWAYDWETRRTMFLNGDVDLVTVPRSSIRYILGQDGTRCVYPLPLLSLDALFFTFKINETTPYGPILSAGTFSETGIPSDFFGNETWGIHTRRAFAFALDYDTMLSTLYLGEATHPVTAIVPGLVYFDPTIEGYTYNLTRAAEEFKKVPGLWQTGFTMTLVYALGISGQYVAEMVKSGIESLNPKFHVEVKGVLWTFYMGAANRHELPIFWFGWTADNPDPHDIAYNFYCSKGMFGAEQLYDDPAMDALIEAGVEEFDPTARAVIYHDVQALAVEDCASIPLFQPMGRHFEKDWITGWYYNPGYPGVCGYNLWKWYYAPHAFLDNSTQPTSNCLPADVNYDGKVNIIDITAVALAFDSSYGPPMHPRWQFRADVDNNREVNIIDITLVSRWFGKTSAVWKPPS